MLLFWYKIFFFQSYGRMNWFFLYFRIAFLALHITDVYRFDMFPPQQTQQYVRKLFYQLVIKIVFT